MIKNKSRKGWFGASDTAMIMGNWSTATFLSWWMVKLGLAESFGGNRYTRAGTEYEHKILDAIGVKKKDRQIRIKKLRLRVNLDGEDKECIYEVKTHKTAVFRACKAYWQQAQVEMYATKKKIKIVAYHMTDENYVNYFLPIDSGRVTYHPIEYDAAWIREKYLPRLRYLAACLKKGEMPNESGFEQFVARLQNEKTGGLLALGRRLLGRIRKDEGQAA